MVIGREADCDIAIAAQAISRRHARISRASHGWMLEDLDSSNGTFVNGERLETTAQPLRDGDEVVLAGRISLRFSDPQATPMAPAIGRLVGIWIDPDTSAVWVDAQPVEPPLSQRQQALLQLLADNYGEIVTRQVIVEQVWADVAAEGVSSEAIDALVKRLRNRIRPLELHGQWIDVQRGRGIRLIDPDGSP